MGLNTLLLSASPTPVPDIVALAASLDGDGRVKIPGTHGTGVLQVAAANVGATGTLTVSADFGLGVLPVSVSLCEVDPASPTGSCSAAPAPTVTTTIAAGATRAFAVFVAGAADVPFDPANKRVFVRFGEAGVTRGATSVSVETLK